MQRDNKTVGEKARSRTENSMIACHECDLLVTLPALEEKQKAFCPRCGYMLTAKHKDAINRILAFSTSGLLFLALAMSFPFISFSAQGHERVIGLQQSIDILIQEDYTSLALMIYLSIIIIPAVFLAGIFYVYLAIKCGRLFPATRVVMRTLLTILPWSMVEIFLIGILVSFIKIISLADVSLGLSFWAYVFFTVSLTMVIVHLDKHQVWKKLHAIDT
jgi:paraquat-inducible protein A